MPKVETYMPSALPCSTTFVSPPMIETPALRAAIAIASISLSSALVGKPDSRMSVAIKAIGRAADTAKSFNVPLTASSPIEPPGKRSGRTTKPSAVVAIFTLPSGNVAASVNACKIGFEKYGAIRPSTRRRDAVPPAPCAISICVSAKRGVLRAGCTTVTGYASTASACNA